MTPHDNRLTHFKYRAIVWSLLCLASVTVAPSARVNAVEVPPNIVLLMGDDHGWDETGYNGHPYLATPVLDEMAATGLRLDRFYSAHPSCSPTRGSIITGRHPVRYGTFSPNCSIRPEEISIAQLLKQQGYRCGHFGKWHLGPVKAESPTSPGAMGFDSWLSHDNFFELDPVLSRDGGAPSEYPGESSEVIVAEAIRFIEQTRRDGVPFFVVIWFGSPHEPYSGLPSDLERYADLPDDLAEKMVRLTSNDTGRPTERPLKDVLQERYAEITAMDRSIGQLRKSLTQQDARENTLLWYCGDNGSPSGAITTSPLRGQKGNHYEGGVRVPGVIEWPAVARQPRSTSVNMVTTDIFPTLCELVGQPLPKRPIDGVSLAAWIRGQRLDRRETPICFWSFESREEQQQEPYILPELQIGTTPLVKLMAGKPTRTFRNFKHPEIRPRDFGGTRAILDSRYKLVVDGGRTTDAKRELFDIRADPNETHDLSQQKPDVADSLSRQLRQWQRSALTSLTGADYP